MQIIGGFPEVRLRRLRSAPWLREMVAETRLHPADLIWPVFVHEGAENVAVPSLEGVQRFALKNIAQAVKHAQSLGICAVAIFPVVPAEKKSDDAREVLRADNLIHRAIAEIKNAVPDIGIIADVALDPYTSHGHDGLLKNGDVANDETVAMLAQQAIALAKAGADILAPSDMMDGRVGAIRAALDADGFSQRPILSYAAKYASAFYGPFRDAVGSASALGKADKRSYQMNPANAREALREVWLDVAEGADMLMVKPASHYLDVIASLRTHTTLPIFAYQVSGEYAMIKLAAQQGLIDADAAMMEALISIKRAGAQGIFTYAACEIAKKIAKD